MNVSDWIVLALWILLVAGAVWTLLDRAYSAGAQMSAQDELETFHASMEQLMAVVKDEFSKTMVGKFVHWLIRLIVRLTWEEE